MYSHFLYFEKKKKNNPFVAKLQYKVFFMCKRGIESVEGLRRYRLYKVILKSVHTTTDRRTKSTSRHIFESVLICIERGLYSVYFKEINLFEKKLNFFPFFTSQLSFSQLGEQKEHLFQ